MPQFFAGEGCNMVEMTCEEHDRQAASTQFITHTVGRILGAMDLKSTDINTKARCLPHCHMIIFIVCAFKSAHTVGRILGVMDLKSTNINAKFFTCLTLL